MHLKETFQSVEKPKNSRLEKQQGPRQPQGQSSPRPYEMRALNASLPSSFLTSRSGRALLSNDVDFKQKGHGPIKGRSNLWNKPLKGALDPAADVAYKINHVCWKPALTGEPKGLADEEQSTARQLNRT